MAFRKLNDGKGDKGKAVRSTKAKSGNPSGASHQGVVYRIGVRVKVRQLERRTTADGKSEFVVVHGEVHGVSLPSSEDLRVYVFDKTVEVKEGDYLDVVATKPYGTKYWRYQVASEGVSRQLDQFLGHSTGNSSETSDDNEEPPF